MFHGHGIYRIEHAHVPVRIALPKGSSDDRTPLIACGDNCLDHMWLIEPVHGETDTYTLRNLVGGSYMDMSGGSSKNGTFVVGFHNNGGENQKWIIRPEQSGTGFWMIQSKNTRTFVDLLNGGSGNGTKIVGWQANWNDGNSDGHRHWKFSCKSVTPSEVHTMLQAHPSLHQDFKCYRPDGLYLILSAGRFMEIWESSGLNGRKLRSQIFDCDDFAFAYKAEVGKWGNVHFKADGFAILCGVMFGSNPDGTHAYNWMVDYNQHDELVFFDPQNAELSRMPGNHTAYFGVF